MSVLLLTNPYTPPQQVPSTSVPSAAALAQTGVESPTAIPPTQQTAGQNGSGSATSYSGSGAGAGGAAAQFALKSDISFSRPPDAAPGSVVNAQATAETFEFAQTETARELPDPLPTSPFLKRAGDAA